MAESQRSFRLVVDRLGVGRDHPAAVAEDALTLPKGLSYLVVDRDGRPRLVDERPRQSRFLLWETSSQASRLLLARPASWAVRLNGLRAPRLSMLEEGDQVEVARGWVLHVALYCTPRLGPPPQGHVGRACPLCQTPFAADTRVYTCLQCGALLHLEDESVPDAERLQCALAVSTCPVCTAEIELRHGYRRQPERYHVG